MKYPQPRDNPLDPPPAYAHLREQPIQTAEWNGRDVWLISRFAEVRAVLADARVSSDVRRPGFPRSHGERDISQFEDGSAPLLRMDSPQHEIERRMVVMDFATRLVEPRRDMVQQVVDACIDRMVTAGDCADLVTAFAQPIPVEVISRMMGIAEDAFVEIEEVTRRAFDVASSPDEVRRSTATMHRIMERQMLLKLDNPQEDVLSRLAQYVRAGDVTLQRAVMIAVQLPQAGHHTGVAMLALGALTLFQHPDQLAELQAEPTLMAGAVEEMLRYLTVVHQSTRRLAIDDIDVGDQVIRGGDALLALTASANRDPAIFDDPDRFDIRRPNARHHLAFGFGVHQCLGQTLARLELEVAFATLLRRLPRLRLAAQFEELEFVDGITYSIASLPVTWS
jgi:cytochrome P450